jgi:hypothetical protein
MKRKSRVLNPKDVPPIPKDVAIILSYPVGIDLNGKVMCCNCGGMKPVLKTRYIGNGLFKCKHLCKKKEG